MNGLTYDPRSTYLSQFPDRMEGQRRAVRRRIQQASSDQDKLDFKGKTFTGFLMVNMPFYCLHAYSHGLPIDDPPLILYGVVMAASGFYGLSNFIKFRKNKRFIAESEDELVNICNEEPSVTSPTFQEHQWYITQYSWLSCSSYRRNIPS